MRGCFRGDGEGGVSQWVDVVGERERGGREREREGGLCLGGRGNGSCCYKAGKGKTSGGIWMLRDEVDAAGREASVIGVVGRKSVGKA